MSGLASYLTNYETEEVSSSVSACRKTLSSIDAKVPKWLTTSKSR